MKILGSEITLPVWLGQLRQFYTMLGGILIALALNLPPWMTNLFGPAGTEALFGFVGAAIVLYQQIRSAKAPEKKLAANRLTTNGINVNPVWMGQLRGILTLLGTLLVTFSINVPEWLSNALSTNGIAGLMTVIGGALMWLSSLSSAKDPAKVINMSDTEYKAMRKAA